MRAFQYSIAFVENILRMVSGGNGFTRNKIIAIFIIGEKINNYFY